MSEHEEGSTGMKENTQVHTGLLRFTLGIDESRAYWAQVDPKVSPSSLQVFEESWFPHKSQSRVVLIMRALRMRYQAYPAALEALHAWPNMDLYSATVIAHWHTQLADPLYRRFSAWVAQRRITGPGTIRKAEVVRWLENEYPERWAATTMGTWATKLLAAAAEVGLVSSRRDPRPLACPRVNDQALTYILYLLRELRFQGSMVDNPYLSSVGLDGGVLADRIGQLPDISLNRMGDLVELTFKAPSLVEWVGGSQ